MKQVMHNRYFKGFCFSSSREALTFSNSLIAYKRLSFEETYGDYFYFYVCYHSLTQETLFTLSFSSDEREDNLNLLYWNGLLVLDTGRNVYIIDETVNIKASLEITTPLVGLYLINDEKLLVLEEAFIRVVNCHGEVVMSELTDLIKNFSIKDNLLSIETDEENRVMTL